MDEEIKRIYAEDMGKPVSNKHLLVFFGLGLIGTLLFIFMILIIANGNYTHVGAVACNFLPFGTRVVINGNTYIVEDRVGMSGRVIDIYMPSYDDCINWGRQYLTVEVIE